MCVCAHECPCAYGQEVKTQLLTNCNLSRLETGMKKPAVVPGVVPGVRKIGTTKGPKRPLPLPVVSIADLGVLL